MTLLQSPQAPQTHAQALCHCDLECGSCRRRRILLCKIKPGRFRDMEVPHINQEVSLHVKDQPSVASGVCRTLLKDWGKLSDDDIEVRKLVLEGLHKQTICLKYLAFPTN